MPCVIKLYRANFSQEDFCWISLVAMLLIKEKAATPEAINPKMIKKWPNWPGRRCSPSNFILYN